MFDYKDYGGERLRIDGIGNGTSAMVLLNGEVLRGLVGLRVVRQQPIDGKGAATVILILTGVEALDALAEGEDCPDLTISIGDNAKSTLAAWKPGA